MQDNISINHI